jgi:hypothetical protein
MSKYCDNSEQIHIQHKDKKDLERDFFEECERTKKELKEAQLQLKRDIKLLNNDANSF